MNKKESAAELIERQQAERQALFDSAMRKQNAWAWKQTWRIMRWLLIAAAAGCAAAWIVMAAR